MLILPRKSSICWFLFLVLVFISLVVIPCYLYFAEPVAPSSILDQVLPNSGATNRVPEVIQIDNNLTPLPKDHDGNKAESKNEETSGDSLEMPVASEESHQKYFKNLFEMFHTYRPNIAKPLNDYPNGTCPTDSSIRKHPFDREELSSYLQVSQENLDILKKTHRSVVDHLPSTYPEMLYNGTGVVIVGGGRFMPIAVSCIRMLRRTNTDIPIEVFIENSKEYEVDLCDGVLPSLNAKCVSLEERLGKDVMEGFAIKGFQFKGLSLLTSSFENVLLLDADNFPIHDPMTVFQSDPFKSTGYILWPDYWRRTTSPDFYDIANVKLGERVRGDLTSTEHVPLHHLENSMPDMSTESGQLVISKRRHFQSLILSTYYNLYGYSTYYPLLSQGAMGQGDKETFSAAATVLNESVYYIQSGVRAGGYHAVDGFHGVSMYQTDPQEDFNMFVAKSTKKVPKPIFLHNHMTKMDPMSVVLTYPKRYPRKGDSQAYRIRFFGKLKDNTAAPIDLELAMWEESQWMVCEMALKNKMPLRQWAREFDDKTTEDVCQRIIDHIHWLKENPNPDAMLLPYDQKVFDEKKKKEKQT